jgi:hypothetical protein
VYRVSGSSSPRLLLGVRSGRVTFVAVADKTLIANRKALRTQLRRAALIRSR